MNPFPMATGPDPILAARIAPGFSGLHPMLALQAAHAQAQAQAAQQQAAVSGAAISPASLAAHYLQSKTGGATLGSLFAGYNVMLHPGPPGAAPMHPHFMTSPMAPSMASSTAEGLTATRIFSNDPETIDMRKSSIDALRMKAREHSANFEHRMTSPDTSEVKS